MYSNEKNSSFQMRQALVAEFVNVTLHLLNIIKMSFWCCNRVDFPDFYDFLTNANGCVLGGCMITGDMHVEVPLGGYGIDEHILWGFIDDCIYTDDNKEQMFDLKSVKWDAEKGDDFVSIDVHWNDAIRPNVVF